MGYALESDNLESLITFLDEVLHEQPNLDKKIKSEQRAHKDERGILMYKNAYTQTHKERERFVF